MQNQTQIYQQPNVEETQKPPKKKRRIWLWVLLIIIGAIVAVFVAAFVWVLINSSSSYVPGADNVYDKTVGIGAERQAASPGLGSSEEAFENKSADISTSAGNKSAAGDSELTEKKVVRTGALTITVDKVGDTSTKVISIANLKNGFVQDSNKSIDSNGQEYATVTIKVPVDKFDEAVNEIKKLAKIVDNEKLSGQDVTEQYVDLKARLDNAKATEAQYLEILKQAKTVDDTLKVTVQLDSIREKIEIYEGQLKYLENQTDMSTITVTIQEEAAKVATKSWSLWTTVKNASKTWLNTAKAVISGLVWIIIFGVPILIIIWLIVKVTKYIVRKAREKKG